MSDPTRSNSASGAGADAGESPASAPGLGSRYRVLRLLGEGGTGAVYHARDLLEDRDVAIKVFPHPEGDSQVALSSQVDFAGGTALLARSEFRLLASNHHPNIVRVHDFGLTADGRSFFSMELIDGPDLLTFARGLRSGDSGDSGDGGGLAAGAALADCTRQILDALDALHRRGILLLDLKPENILVTVPPASPGRSAGSPFVKLIDFGLARLVDPRFAAPPSSGTGPGAVSGTAEYLAPERIRGEPPSPRCDLYALGVILYELFTGQSPFRGESATEVIRAHLEAPVPHPERLPDRFRGTILRLLEKSPAKRPATAWEVRLELFGEPESPAELWPPFEVAFVGREDLMRRLEWILRPEESAGSASQGARDGVPRCALLEGERGVGKTRVLREIQLRHQLEGRAVVLESAGGARHDPGELFRRILAHLRQGEGSARRAGELLRELDDLVQQGDCSAGEGRSPAAGAAVLEGRRHKWLHGMVRHLLAQAALRPLTLLIDDLESADSLSLEGVLSILRAVEYRDSAGLRVVLASRGGAGDPGSAAGEIRSATRGFTSLESLRIGGLDPAAIEDYLRQVLGTGAFPTGLVDVLVAQAGGNALFIQEYLKLLVHSRGIRREGSSWKVLPQTEFDVPPTVEDALSRRIDRLPERAVEILRWAAVLSRPFAAQELETLLRLDATVAGKDAGGLAGFRRDLLDLAFQDLLTRDGRRFSLASGALRRVVTASMAPGELRRRHSVAAGQLLKKRGAGARVQELAHHLFLGEKPARARPYLLEGGRRARRSGALREAERDFSRALDLTAGEAERFDLLLLREEVLGHLGRKADQEKDVEALRELAERLGGADRLRETALRGALYLESLGRKREALDSLEQILEKLEDDPDGKARVLSRAGMLRMLLGEIDPGLEAFEAAASQARSSGDSRLEAECAQLMGLAHYRKADHDQALREMRRALVLFRDEGERDRVGAIESNIGLVQLSRGRLDAAQERFRSSLKVFHQVGLRRGEAVNLLNLGLVHLERGRFERALDSITEALSIRRELGDRRAEGADLGNLAEVWIRIGFPERAAPLAERAVELARELENQQSECANECRLAQVELAEGNPRAALSHAEPVIELARAPGLAVEATVAHAVAARARMALEDAGKAHAEAQAALELAASQRLAARLPALQALVASTSLAREDLAGAERHSREAVALLEGQPDCTADASEIWFTRYRVLEARRRQVPRQATDAPAESLPHAAESEEALRRAYALLREMADRFEDGELREGFLSNVPLHREINRLHEILQSRVRRDADARERSFHEIARSIHSIVQIDPLLDRLLSLAIETTHAEKGLITLKNSDGGFTIRAARGMASESVDDAADICRSVIQDVARGGGPILATDAGSDDRFRDRRSIITFQIRTLMCVPMVVRDEIVGAVYVDGRGAASFDRDDLDYLVSFSQLAAIAVENTRLLERLRAENLHLRREVETRYRFENLVGECPAMDALAAMVEKVAGTPASVLVSGETGTGKELVARAIHHASDRKGKRFVAVDCGALPENLLESELFGHRKGAFSGATHDRVGLFEEASGGTLFLDEVTNMGLDLQVKLLRVLQEGEIRRLGENQVRKIDVRVVAASNVPVREAVKSGKFREDLYYRLNVVSLDVPPLRERREDIPLLAHHFLEKSCRRIGRQVEGFTQEAMRFLAAAPWKGNVRELENLVEKAVILTESERIDAAFLENLLPSEARPTALVAAGGGVAGAGEGVPPQALLPQSAPGLSLQEFDRRWLAAEKAYLQELVAATGGNLSEAARRAGVRNRNTLISRMKKHGLRRDKK